MQHGAPPSRRSFLQVVFFVAPFVVAAFVLFLAGMAVLFAIEHRIIQRERNEIDCIISKIASGVIAPGSDGVELLVCAGKPDGQWYAGESGGEYFYIMQFSDRNRVLTTYQDGEDYSVFAIHLAGGSSHAADHWFFIDRDKFDAYLDANTGGRFTRSAPLTDPAPAD